MIQLLSVTTVPQEATKNNKMNSMILRYRHLIQIVLLVEKAMTKCFLYFQYISCLAVRASIQILLMNFNYPTDDASFENSQLDGGNLRFNANHLLGSLNGRRSHVFRPKVGPLQPNGVIQADPRSVSAMIVSFLPTTLNVRQSITKRHAAVHICTLKPQ